MSEDTRFKLPQYRLGVFDCSQASAYVEWSLESLGFDAYIAVGPAPWDVTGYHAWVLVNIEGDIVVIEATMLLPGAMAGIIPQSNLRWEAYHRGYDLLFNDIFEAVSYYGTDEWDWWNTIEGYDYEYIF